MFTETKWASAQLRAIRDLTPTIRAFDLVGADGPLPAFGPGDHLDVEVQVNGRQEQRSYSLVGEFNGTYRLAIRRRDDGRGGSAYLWSLAPGARLRVSVPRSAFAVDWTRPDYLLIAGGIGITPLLGMAQRLARLGRRVRLLYAVRRDDDVAFGTELAAALGSGPHIYNSGKRQRIDFDRVFADLAPNGMAAICGPLPMLEAAQAAWARTGRPIADLRWETFGSSGRAANQAFTVKLPLLDREVIVPANRSMLEALEDAGIEVLSECRRGECGLCALDVLDHHGIDHRDVYLGPAERTANQRICACVSRADGTITVDTAYRAEQL